MLDLGASALETGGGLAAGLRCGRRRSLYAALGGVPPGMRFRHAASICFGAAHAGQLPQGLDRTRRSRATS
ncbi:MAG: hypothetical protein MZV65_33175 [Chromatiales bacterium]|nr:hypothetical protein [Chromatiales bacterium]